jgi:hypothetical protein
MVKLTVTPRKRRASSDPTGEPPPPPPRGIVPPSASASLLNRESYLIAAIDRIRPLFQAAGLDVPPVRVSVGWPGGRGGKNKIGSCWPRAASKDGTFQVFVSPVVDDTHQALGVLVHELCHACTDCSGHGADFSKLARAVGLEGKLTATYPSQTLLDRLNGFVIEPMGTYPHSAIVPEESGEKKQGTRMVKCVCEESGYTCRTTRSWLDQYGAPISPKTKRPMTVIEPEPTGGEESA